MFKKILYLTFVFVFAFSCFSMAFEVEEIKGMKNIKSVHVCLNGCKLEDFGLTIDGIKTAVELKLRLCGLNLCQKEAYVKDAAYVTVSILPVNTNTASAICLKITIEEFAVLSRTDLISFSTVWKSEIIYLCGNKTKLGSAIMCSINEMMDEFSNLYLEANPRKFIEDMAQ